MKNKKILYLIGLLIVYYIISRFMIMNIEGYDNIDKYLKTVDLPITFPFSCKNFCGPGNRCVITGEQCSNDYDCSGCENIPKMKPPKVDPYYRELSSRNEQMGDVYVGSKNNLPPLYYSGGNDWINIFNKGMEIYNRKVSYNEPLDDFEQSVVSIHPPNITMTGQYYENMYSSYNRQ